MCLCPWSKTQSGWPSYLRIYDLFGLSVDSATRYLKTMEHPDLSRG